MSDYLDNVLKASGGAAAPEEVLEDEIPEGYHRMPDGTVMKDSAHDNEAALEKDSDDPCWDNYIQVGMKKKSGKMVPNCVPKDAAEVGLEDLILALENATSVEDITPHLVTYAITETRNFDAPRAVTAPQINAILASSATPEQAVLDVVSFIELAHNNEVYESSMNYQSLLASGHPRTSVRGISAAARADDRGAWYAADLSLSEMAKKSLLETYSEPRNTVTYKFAQLKIDALIAGGELAPLTAAFNMSFAKRSAMSKLLAAIRRRDRKGRFAEEFGRLKGFFGGKDKNFTAVGQIVGATAGSNDFQVQYKGDKNIPDGIYSIDASKTENVGAYLPARAVKNLPSVDVPFDEADKDSLVPLDQFLATKMDAPSGWKAIKNEQGKITGYQTDDGSKVMSIGKLDPKKADELTAGETPVFGSGENDTLDPSEPLYTLKDPDGTVLAYAQGWAGAQKAAIYTDIPDTEGDSTPDVADTDLGEQYGLDKTTGGYRANGAGGEKYDVYKTPEGWEVETTFDDGNVSTEQFKTDEDAFKYVAGEAGLDPTLDSKVDTPEEKPKTNSDGVEYGKYDADTIADGYQFDKESSDTWTKEGVVDGEPAYVKVSKGEGDNQWFVETENRDGKVISGNEFETPEDAFDYAALDGNSTWDQSWVDDLDKPESSDGGADSLDATDKLAYDNGFDKTTNGYSATSGEGGMYEIYEDGNGGWVLENRYSDGNSDTENFDTPEAAFEEVAKREGDSSANDYTADELALGYAFSKNSDGTYEAPDTTSDGANIKVSESNGKWVVTELGGNGPDNFNEVDLADFDNPAEAFDFANDQMAQPTNFDDATAKSESDEADSIADAAPPTPDTSIGEAIEAKNRDEDGILTNDMFYVDNAIDDHKELYFETNQQNLIDKLEDNMSGDTTTYGDYMTGGAQIVVSQQEDGTWSASVQLPDGDKEQTFDELSDALEFASLEGAIHNTNAIPSALANGGSFSNIDSEVAALETPDQALTYAVKLDEIADALEGSRGPKEQVDALRGMSEMIREEYGQGDDTQDTKFFRMMAEESPLSSSINPNVDPDSVDAPVGEGSTDEKKSVTSNQAAVDKVLAGMISAIESGDSMPWRQPFTDDPSIAGANLPRNPVSKHIYSGLNSMVLRWTAGERGYTDGRWVTYKGAQGLGGNVRKGEKGTFILRPNIIPMKDKDGKPVLDGAGNPRKFITFGTISVFNIAQVDGLDLPDEKKNDSILEAKTPLEAQNFVIDRYMKSMEALGLEVPKINYTYVGMYGSHSSSPNWSPLMDQITLPTLEQFNSPEEIFDTLMHEMAHSTGHASRLDRTALTKDYGNSDGVSRAREELIAEISSAILGQMFGIENTLDNSAAYVQSWLKRLQSNPNEVVNATKEAQKVVDYMLGMHIGDWSPVDGYSAGSSKGGSK